MVHGRGAHALRRQRNLPAEHLHAETYLALVLVALGGAFIWIMLTLLCVLQLEPGPGEKVDEGEDAAWVPARRQKDRALALRRRDACDESALSGDDASLGSSEWDKRHRRRIAGTKVRRRGNNPEILA